MRRMFYTRLALSNIRRNRKFYFPYILTCICTVAMFYIVAALCDGNMLDGASGENVLRSYMALGAVVIAIFAIIFLFYTNSFLTRRRRREFGVYNILGMGKGHIARVMLIETLIIAAVSLILGIAAGAGLAKLVALGAMKLTHSGATYGMEFVMISARLTVYVFAGIFALSYVVELIRMGRSSTIDLLKSENQGEREPKTKWLMTLLGALCLGGGYYIAVSTQNPLEAFALFFVAVILVIFGTYLLFTAGSIALLKMLRAHRNYYYKPNHFISVSGMIFRMKQNAAGLASICILSTMVLVMVSATVSLTLGNEDSVSAQYPFEMVVVTQAEDTDEGVRTVVESVLAEYDVKPENYQSFLGTDFAAERIGNTFNLSVHDDFQTLNFLYFMTYDDYARIGPDAFQADLAPDEILVAGDFPHDTMNLASLTFKVSGHFDSFSQAGSGSGNMLYPELTIVVRDIDALSEVVRVQREFYGEEYAIKRYYGFDVPLKGEQLELATTHLESSIGTRYEDNLRIYGPRWEGRENSYALTGGLMFLGIFLGILFVMATVLLMYYRQISEGYDDRERFQIMRKVGLDDGEIRKSIHSQIITVFFLPLLAACVHTAMACFIVRRVLMVFGLRNTGLMIACTAGSIGVFAVFYIVTYLVTSSVYYRIVAREAA